MNNVLLAMLAGICFGGWPFIMKRSGMDPYWACFALNATTTLIVLPFLRGNAGTGWTIAAVALAVTAGLANGIGAISLQKVIASVQTADLPQMIFVLMMTQLVITTIGDIAVKGSSFTLNRGLAIAAAGVAITLFTRR